MSRAPLYSGRFGTKGTGLSYFEGGDERNDDLGVEFREYITSSSSKVKRELVKKIAEALSSLGIRVSVDGTTEQIASSIEKEVTELKLKPSLDKDKNGQEQFCKKVAETLNTIFTPGAGKHNSSKLIDTSLSPASICSQIFQFLHDLVRGLPVELFEVQPDIKNVLRRSELLTDILKTLLDRTDEIILSLTSKSDDFSPQVTDYKNLHSFANRTLAELKRQHISLAAIMKVVLPESNDEMARAFSKGSDMKRLMDELIGNNIKLGTTKFAQSLRELLTGMSTVATVAADVENALAKVGIQVKDYVNTVKNLDDLNKLINDKLAAKGSDMKPIYQAGQLLKQHFDEDELKQYLKQNIVGGRGPNVPMSTLEKFDISESDIVEENGIRRIKTSVEKQLDTAKFERRTIVNLFSESLSNAYNKIHIAIKSIVDKLGNTIPITHETDIIRDYIKNLSNINNTQPELYLLGIESNGEARSAREFYITAFKSVIKVCENENGFKPVVDAINNLLEIVNKFYERTKELSFNKYERHKNTTYDIEQGASGGDYEDEDEKDKKDVFDPMFSFSNKYQSSDSLTRSINEFVYKYYIVGVKANMRQSAKIYEKNIENYQEILGLATGNTLNMKIKNIKEKWKLSDPGLSDLDVIYKLLLDINDVNRLYAFTILDRNILAGGIIDLQRPKLLNKYKLHKFLFDFCKDVNSIINDIDNARAGRDTVAIMPKMITKFKQYIKKNETEEIKQLCDFYDMLQAGELYLQNFTKNAINNIDIVGNLKQEIEKTDFIANWYTNKTIWLINNMKFLDTCVKYEKFSMNIYFETGGVMRYDFDLAEILKNIPENDKFEYLIHVLSASNMVWENLERTVLNPDIPDANNRENYFTADVDAHGVLIINNFYFDNCHNYFLSLKNKDPVRYYSKYLSVIKDLEIRTEASIIDTVTYLPKRLQINFKNEIKKIFENFMALKNIIGIFAKIGNKDNTFMNYSNFYNHIIDYLINSSVDDADLQYIDINALGLDVILFKNNDENLLFIDMIKSICAQIITVVGAYNMVTNITPLKINNITRLIIGNSENLLIIKDAAELYFRLPKLANYYKKYVYNKGSDSDDYVFAMLPEINGIFSNFISLMYIHLAETSIFTESDIKDIIMSINEIYTQYQGKSNATILNDFMDEINYRMGAIKKSQLNKYWTTIETIKKKQYNMRNKDSSINFKILPNENEYTTSNGAPSSKYLDLSAIKSSDINTDFIINKKYKKLLNDLQDEIYNDITKAPINISFNKLIEQAKCDIENSKTEKDKFKIAYMLVQTSNNEIDYKYYIMCEETVGVCLENINSILNILDLIKIKMDRVNLIKYINLSDVDRAAVIDNTDYKFWSNNIPVGNFNGAANTEPDIDNRVNALLNLNIAGGLLSINTEFVMREMLDLLMMMNATEFIKITFISKNKFIVDFSKIQDISKYFLEEARRYINKLKSYLPVEYIQDKEQELFNYEKTLVDKYFVDDNLAKMSAIFQKNFEILLVISDTYERSFRSIIYYDFSDPNAPDDSAPVHLNLVKYLEDTVNNHTFDRENEFVINKLCTVAPKLRHKQECLYLDEKINYTDRIDKHIYMRARCMQLVQLPLTYDSLMFEFNKSYSSLLCACINASDLKIYGNIINIFANGPASNAVSRPFGNSWPDIFVPHVGGYVGLPTPLTEIDDAYLYGMELVKPGRGGMLFQSLALITQRLMTDKILPAETTFKYLIPSLTDVPLFMKEKLKCVLPLFIKKFKSTVDKCNLMKTILEKTSIKINITSNPYANTRDIDIDEVPEDPIAHTPAYSQVNQTCFMAGSEDIFIDVVANQNTLMISYLDEIISYSESLIKGCGNVIKELTDSPVFMEFDSGSIENFKLLNGDYQFTPISALFVHLPAIEQGDLSDIDHLNKIKNIFNNNVYYGSNEFKALYGIRNIFTETITPDYIPCIIEMLKKYNEIVKTPDNIDIVLYTNFCENTRKVFNFILDITYFKLRNSSYIDPEINLNIHKTIHSSYEVDEIVYEINNTDIIETQKIYSNKLHDQNASQSNYDIANIIDMNKIPFNLNALAKDVPYIHIYNFSSMFDKYVTELFQYSLVTEFITGPYDTVAYLMEDDFTANTMGPTKIDSNILSLHRTRNDYGHGTDIIKNEFYDKVKFLSDLAKLFITSDADGIKTKAQYIVDDNDSRFFSSVLIRHLIFITKLQYIIKNTISRIYIHNREQINTGEKAMVINSIDYGIDPFDADETYYSKINGKLSRFSNQDTPDSFIDV